MLEWLVAIAMLIPGVLAAGHALLYKRRPRAATGWVAICLAIPLVGALMYFLLGINRVHTRARKLRHRWMRPAAAPPSASPHVPAEFRELARISDSVSSSPLTGENQLECLHDGEEAYPAMLRSIAKAEHSVCLSTYLFATDATGKRFVTELARAAARGVEVQVLVDGIGELYSLPRVSRLLRRHHVRVARFLPPRLLPPALHLNLRNHRKILVTDLAEAFTGGMNIGDRHLAANLDNAARVRDVHFRLSGPIVAQMKEIFARDWEFVTGERPAPRDSRPARTGEALCRTIVEGPDENLDKLQTILIGAASAARRELLIMTPYFLPPRELLGALQGAALRGVDVVIILPAKNNLPYVHWATRNMLWELLQRGVKVLYQPPPFAHSKLFIVDGHYAQIGSANLDPRSLRLNFELNVEVYDRAFATRLVEHFTRVRASSRPVTLGEVDARPLPVRLRDSLAWLLTPYL